MGIKAIGFHKLAAGLSATLLISSAAPANAFPDVDSGRWFAKYVNYLQTNNMVSGYPDNTFRPNSDVTRAEFAAMLAKSRGLTTSPGVQTQFSDVPASHWASGPISLASSKGWITGYPDGTFGPAKPITHAEMYTIVSKLLEGEPPANTSTILADFTDAGSIPTWAEQPVAMVLANGVYINEVTPKEIEPFSRATRADVASTLAKLVNTPFRTPVSVTIAEVPEAQPPEPELNPVPEPKTVTSTGTIRRTPNGWMLHTLAGVYQIATDSMSYGRFIEGQEVNFTGALLPPQSPMGRHFVRLTHFQPITVGRDLPNRPNRNVTASGVLQPAQRGTGWAVTDTATNQRFVLLNVAGFETKPWFKAGQSIEVQGNVRPGQGAALPANTLPLFVTMAQPRQAGRPVLNVVGRLNRTVEAGGWTVTDRVSKQKYLLTQVDAYKNRRWFQEGQAVKVEGTARPNRPNMHMEGTPLAVTDMQALPI